MNRNMFKHLTALALAVLLVFSAGPSAQAAEEGAVTVTLNKTSLSMAVGETATLSARVKRGEQDVSDAKVTYASTDSSKVKVDPTSGKVEAVAVGSAVIKAIYQDKDKTRYEASCTVTVSPPVAVTGVALTPSGEQILEVGEQTQLSVSVSPSDATNKTVTCRSSDSQTASVSNSGLVKALAPGETLISALSNNKITSNEVKIKVSGLRLTGTLSLFVGQSETLTYGKFGDAESKNIVWSSSNISVAGVKDGKVSAYNPGTAEITATAGKYSASCTVTVKEDVAKAVTESMKVGESFSFSDIISGSDGLNSRALEKIGTSLEYVSGLSVATDEGILHYGYGSPDVPGSGVGSSEIYYVNPSSGQRDLEDVSFVPASTFSGTAVISYTGYGNGKNFSGSIRISVENSGDVAYSTTENRPLPLVSEDFSSVCRTKTGRMLRHVTFQLPSESKGTLYYNYSTTGQYSQPVSTSSLYYVTGGSMLLSNVTFVPAEGYTGTLTVPYYGTDNSGSSYSGKITITVYEADQYDAQDIAYRVSSGSYVSFDASDFNEECIESIGSSLNYIYLDRPSPDQGTLYYNYTSSGSYGGLVSESTRYFRSSSPRISYIDFVPADDFTGTVRIPYTGYGSAGEQFEGEIVIRVNGGEGTVRYSTSAGRAVDFESLDFNECCLSSSGSGLDYVQFELPASSKGTLYYNYVSSNSKGGKVTESRRYTRGQLSSITFVPKSSFSGTVSIPFSGYDTSGGRFSGTVEIIVDSIGWDDTISYTAISGGTAIFDTSDFNDVCKYLTGDNLNYVRFTLPASRYGTLYYDYNANRGSGTQVNANTSYYRSGSTRLLDDVVFAASKNYTGTVNISYSARSTGGEEFEGIVQILVSEPADSTVTYYGSSLPVRFSSKDFRSACAAGLPKDLSYIQFHALPDASYGKLLVNCSRAGTGTAAAANSRYYASGSAQSIDGVCFVAKTAFQGSVTIAYTAVDQGGNTMEGTVRIRISNDYLVEHFNDIGSYGWAAPSIEFLYDSGVVSGYGNGLYGPADTTSRGAFALMICRMFDFAPRTGSGFRDVPVGSTFATEIITAKELGIVSGNTEFFYPQDPITREQAVVMLVRAMKADGRNVTSGSTALLDSYRDGGQVSDYARSAMASMIRMGVISGDAAGNLNPGDPITRAEMAVVLHRLMTA